MGGLVPIKYNIKCVTNHGWDVLKDTFFFSTKGKTWSWIYHTQVNAVFLNILNTTHEHEEFPWKVT